MEDFPPGGLRTRIWGLASIAGLFSRSSLCLEKRKNVRFLIFAKSHKVYDNEKEYYLAKYYNKTKKNLAKNSKINLKIIIVECRKKTENIKTREEIHDGL